MKILFLYTKMDNTLKNRVLHLREHGAEVHMLSLLEQKLHLEDETKIIDIESPFERFEESGSKLRIINRIYKRKKLLKLIDHYDLIDLYKCEKSSLFLKKEIEDRCIAYFITPSNNNQKFNPITKTLYKSLLTGSEFIILDKKSRLDEFDQKLKQKCKIIYDPLPIFEELDNISQENLFKAAYSMGIDFDKDIVYCDMSGALEKQLMLIDELDSMDSEKKREYIFIFQLNNHDLKERTSIKESLNSSKLDFILIDSMTTTAQTALLYKLSNISIILSQGLNNALPISLYAKNAIYLYDEIELDTVFTDERFFYEDFGRFLELDAHEKNPIIQDMIETNSQKAYELFSPEASVQKYIEAIKEI